MVLMKGQEMVNLMEAWNCDDALDESIRLYYLATGYKLMSKYQKALEYFEKSLEITLKL